MLKSIQKSNISRRSFQVFKDFTITDAEINVVSASLETGLFDSGSSDFFTSSVQDKIYTHPIRVKV